jgi:hypothetical protein
MSLIDVAAVVGALAWVPPIFSTVRNWITKPEIRIITASTPEIGYTVLGPILNLQIALTVKHKDIVITGMHIQVRHESGEMTQFSWQGVKQRLGTMTNDQLGVMPYEKDLNVLAMKVSLKDVEERFIQFRSPSFLSRKSELEAVSFKKLAHLRQSNTFDGDAFLQSQEMADLYSYTRQAFSWKPGAYVLSVVLESPDEFTVLDDQYSFNLAPIQIKQLTDNLDTVQPSYATEVLPAKEGEKSKKIEWNWVYPQMQRV